MQAGFETNYTNCAIACFGSYAAANAEKLSLTMNIKGAGFSSLAGFAEAIAQFFT